ncbi:uncharacterized protein YoxC [Oxalobacteraceae bacterium GrIS 1.11]
MVARLPSLAPYRLRILLRMAFLLLALATVGLAVSVLQQEKQLSYKNYQSNFQKTKEQIAATLRHPAGQLALLNPPTRGGKASLHPLLLPYSALDFDDQYKVQQAVAMSGCLTQYGNNGALCVGIGNNPWAGGFIYVAGSFNSAALVAHQRGDLTLEQAHRVALAVTLRGQSYRWIAPFEQIGDAAHGGMRGRLTGFDAAGAEQANAKPIKEFRGWVWQNPMCNKPEQDPADSACVHSSFFSVRLPVGVLQDALFEKKRPVWPPADLDQIEVAVAVLAPGNGPPVLDSKSDTATPTFSLTDLTPLLLPGETLRISKLAPGKDASLAPIELTGANEQDDDSWHVLTTLIRHLPVDAYDAPLENTESIATPLGNYQVVLKGDVRSVSKTLSVVATRVSWFVGAMLLALLLAWLVIEIGIISRITILTRRADKVAKSIKGAGDVDQFDLSDLRGKDELGVLASCLYDLLRRVKEDVEREAIRAEQERDMWHAVGHEIMSPLQSLMVLHGAANDQSCRYIMRMQQAIRVLYGSASPSEAPCVKLL